MKKISLRPKYKVESSSKDSISTWLDVLVGMLVMPDAQRTQVRDELEDHLRSRVDDLLIVGKSEPEAIQIAVAELGETAELAKLITHAHQHSNPRRKMMNIALITVALAGMSFGGFSYINGTGAPGATPSNSGAIPVVIRESPQKRDMDNQTHPFDLSMVSMKKILIAIGDAFDKDIKFSEHARTGEMQGLFTSHIEKFQGEYTFDDAVRALNASFPEGLYGYRLEISDNTILLQSDDEYQRSLVELRVHEIPSQFVAPSMRNDFARSIEDLLRVKFDLSYTSIQVVSGSMVVAATPEIHNKITDLQQELDVVFELRAAKNKQDDKEYSIRDEQRLIEHKKKVAAAKELQLKAIDRIQEEFNSVRNNLIGTNSQMGIESKAIMDLSKQLRAQGSTLSPDEKEQIQHEMTQRGAKHTELEYLHEEYQARYIYLRDRLIDSQYAPLFENLD
tara:strand:+ start:93331 stop:94677 length:1347 start_codon:yes stop_codon:yes gene_type:complete